LETVFGRYLKDYYIQVIPQQLQYIKFGKFIVQWSNENEGVKTKWIGSIEIQISIDAKKILIVYNSCKTKIDEWPLTQVYEPDTSTCKTRKDFVNDFLGKGISRFGSIMQQCIRSTANSDVDLFQDDQTKAQLKKIYIIFIDSLLGYNALTTTQIEKLLAQTL